MYVPLHSKVIDASEEEMRRRSLTRRTSRSIAHFHGNSLSEKEEEREADSLRALAHQVRLLLLLVGARGLNVLSGHQQGQTKLL